MAAEMTKAELEAKLAEAQALIESQKVEIEKQTNKIKEISARGAGWLVTTPNPMYDGITLGIQFTRGQAFVRVDQSVPACRLEPMKDGTIAKMGASPEEVKAIREREKISEAERAVKQLNSDFNYEYVYFDGSETAEEEMAKLMSKRAREYAQALEMAEAMKKTQEMVMPQFMGQSVGGR